MCVCVCVCEKSVHIFALKYNIWVLVLWKTLPSTRFDSDWLRPQPWLLPLPHIIRKLSTSASSRKHPHLFTLTCGRSERLWIMKMNESLHAFDFERQFNDRAALEWFEQNWWVELSESNYWFNSITADVRLLSCTIQ